jgi:hypothetical protein
MSLSTIPALTAPRLAEGYELEVKDKDELREYSVQVAGGDQVTPASQIIFDVDGDEQENRKLLRKIDWHLMPLLCVVYGLQFVSFAAVQSNCTDVVNP